MTTKSFEHLGEILIELTALLRPPEDLTVSQAAEKFRYVNVPGAYVGQWLNSTAWYMIEPMDVTISRNFDQCIFVGPAQSAKTDSLLINNIVYSVMIDPMDMMIVCPSQVAARDFSIRRVDRLHQYSKDVGNKLLEGNGDNTFDKSYVNGMLLTLSWPTPTELAGKPIGRCFLTDRDRMDDDIAGDGDPFDLASKRTTTFGSYAMTVAESSPSREITDLKWIPQTPHEAPPCGGILALYNRGDRRRWYWPCPSCGEYFEGLFTHLEWDQEYQGSNYEKGLTVRMRCPVSNCRIDMNDREEMQFWGLWLKDGQAVGRDGVVFGPTYRNRCASFWLRGVAAAFIKWPKLVAAYLDAMDDYRRTGNEEALRKFYNNDLGEPYIPRLALDARLPETLSARAEKSTGFERCVPPGVRFLVALVDVQRNRFVVQVFGICPGEPFDTYLLDRFKVQRSKRLNEYDEALWVKPATYLEDWDLLIEEVMEKEYPLMDDSSRAMGVRFTACDSGGKAGTTSKAYDFYRRLKRDGLNRRFILLKGDPSPGQPRARISYPDTVHKDMKSGARGDIPLLLLNSNLLKDDLNGRLDCVTPGNGMYRIPDWMPEELYQELCVEVRTSKGWENESGHANEAWDLSYYCIGLCVSELLRIEFLDWNNPPPWAAEWDRNELVRSVDRELTFAQSLESGYDLSKLGAALA